MPDDMLAKHWFAKTFTWTPREVDELSLEELAWIPIIEQALAQAAEKKAKMQEKQQQNQRRARAF